jgi:NTE family protein
MGKRVALALASGAARGLAHVGVIDELNDQGYEICSIAGSSIGALVGSFYAAGTLEAYKQWAISLDKYDVFKLVDFTLGLHGFVKGEKVFNEMHSLGFIPNKSIEELSIPMAIVASDIVNNKEVVFTSGNLLDALRASISIPNVFTPKEMNGAFFVDGGVVNPLPINRLPQSNFDIVVAVDLNANLPYVQPPSAKPKKHSGKIEKQVEELGRKWDEYFGANKKKKNINLGYFEILSRSLQLMQEQLVRNTLETNPPDVLIRIPTDACGTFEFYRAKEMIELGRKKCKEALAAHSSSKNIPR